MAEEKERNLPMSRYGVVNKVCKHKRLFLYYIQEKDKAALTPFKGFWHELNEQGKKLALQYCKERPYIFAECNSECPKDNE